MLRVIGLKLVRLVPVLFLVSLATFFDDFDSGDPAATCWALMHVEGICGGQQALGLDKPSHVDTAALAVPLERRLGRSHCAPQ